VIRLGRAVLSFHAYMEKEEQKQIERISKERLKVFKADDKEAYMKLIDTAKDTRITHLLRQMCLLDAAPPPQSYISCSQAQPERARNRAHSLKVFVRRFVQCRLRCVCSVNVTNFPLLYSLFQDSHLYAPALKAIQS
jgi:hypothetical protein